jgi:hypothetical protein
VSTTELRSLPSAYDVGWLCGVAGLAQRDLQRCATVYAELFPEQHFDPGLFSTIALANTFAAPWCSASQLRLANRAALWTFGLDRRVDTLATSATEVDSIVTSCLSAVNDVRHSDRRELSADPVVAMLAQLHDDLAGCPGYPALSHLWRRELERMLRAMARERRWLQDWPASLPPVADYLDNADSLAVAFVFATHLVSMDGPDPIDGRDTALFVAVRAAQVALRLVNDLATYERDVRTGDLNALLLGIGRTEIGRLIGVYERRCRDGVARLPVDAARLGAYIERQLDYNLAFYAVADYWRG